MISKNRIKKVAGDLYELFWFYTEFWLEPDARRPYTYIMRDLYHQYPLPTVTIIGAIMYCLGRWWALASVKTFVIILVTLFVGELMGHLFWTEKYVAGEQEDPPFNPKDNE